MAVVNKKLPYREPINVDEHLMLVVNMGLLSPYEIALFFVIFQEEANMGYCKRTIRTLAELSNMSVGKAQACKQSLIEKNFIKVVGREKPDWANYPHDVIITYYNDNELFSAMRNQ